MVGKSNTDVLKDAMRNLYHSSSGRFISGAPNRGRVALFKSLKLPFGVDVCGLMGFGATLTHVVTLHHHFSRAKLDVKISASNPLYTNLANPDLLDAYFVRADTSIKPRHNIRYRFYQDLASTHPGEGLTVEKAHDLFFSNYTIKKIYVDDAKNIHSLIGGPALGIHFRGSDKFIEARRIAWDEIVSAARKALSYFGLSKLFVASDEIEFIAHMRLEFGSENVYALDAKHFAQGGVGAHFSGGDPLEMGREALVTMLALSMCMACIRGSSHLSAWSKLMNPKLPVIMLNESQSSSAVFPEGEIRAESHKRFGHQFGF